MIEKTQKITSILIYQTNRVLEYIVGEDLTEDNEKIIAIRTLNDDKEVEIITNRKTIRHFNFPYTAYLKK